MSFLRRLLHPSLVRQQMKFLAVGVFCTAVDFGVFNALWKLAQVDKIVANTGSFAVSVVVSFALNRLWTFELDTKVDWAREAVPFLVVSLVGLVMQNGAIWAAGRWLSTGVIVINAAKVAGVGLIWFLKFFVYRTYVFVDRGAAVAAAVDPTPPPEPSEAMR